MSDQQELDAFSKLKQLFDLYVPNEVAACMMHATLNMIQEDLRAMEERKDAAYLERNQVVAALAKCFPAGIAKTAIEGWSEDWHNCVYIDLPTGQASWHYHDSQAYLFEGLPPYKGAWDGHDTPEKYRRVAALPLRKRLRPLSFHVRIRLKLKHGTMTTTHQVMVPAGSYYARVGDLKRITALKDVDFYPSEQGPDQGFALDDDALVYLDAFKPPLFEAYRSRNLAP